MVTPAMKCLDNFIVKDLIMLLFKFSNFELTICILTHFCTIFFAIVAKIECSMG